MPPHFCQKSTIWSIGRKCECICSGIYGYVGIETETSIDSNTYVYKYKYIYIYKSENTYIYMKNTYKLRCYPSGRMLPKASEGCLRHPGTYKRNERDWYLFLGREVFHHHHHHHRSVTGRYFHRLYKQCIAICIEMFKPQAGNVYNYYSGLRKHSHSQLA